MTTTVLPVERWVNDLIKALDANYLAYCDRMGFNPDFKGYPDCFRSEEGRKYYKIIHQEFDRSTGNYRDAGVHAFVNKKTGEVYKPASWKSPHTKYVRYDLRIIKQREECYARADWAGGYLFLR